MRTRNSKRQSNGSLLSLGLALLALSLSLVMEAGAMNAVATAPQNSPEILSFQQWKQEKVKEAGLRLEEAKRLGDSPAQAGNHEDSLAFQAQWALETAQELEVTDYLVLYLSQFLGSKKLEEAAAQLSRTEVATVLERYISVVQKTPKLRGSEDKLAKRPSLKQAPALRTSGQ